jgi:hypothetical protein
MSTYTAETLQKLQLWRAKAADGTLTLDEMREAVVLMRGDRKAGQSASSTTRRAKAKAEIPSADDMLSELGNI